MAMLTKGYLYAYQVVGYLWWKLHAQGINEEVIKQFDEYMGEYVYTKIWDEQSPNQKNRLYTMAHIQSDKVTDIGEALQICVYKNSLFIVHVCCALVL